MPTRRTEWIIMLPDRLTMNGPKGKKYNWLTAHKENRMNNYVARLTYSVNRMNAKKLSEWMEPIGKKINWRNAHKENWRNNYVATLTYIVSRMNAKKLSEWMDQ